MFFNWRLSLINFCQITPQAWVCHLSINCLFKKQTICTYLSCNKIMEWIGFKRGLLLHLKVRTIQWKYKSSFLHIYNTSIVHSIQKEEVYYRTAIEHFRENKTKQMFSVHSFHITDLCIFLHYHVKFQMKTLCDHAVQPSQNKLTLKLKENWKHKSTVLFWR